MAFVTGVTMTVVVVVGVVAMGHSSVAAVLAVGMGMVVMDNMDDGLTLVPVVAVGAVGVAVVEEVGVTFVFDGHVAAVTAVGMRVLVVDRMGHGHSRIISLAWTTASFAMWDTCSSASE